jgi:hypothetical protein
MIGKPRKWGWMILPEGGFSGRKRLVQKDFIVKTELKEDL